VLDDCPPVRVAALLAVAELLLNHLDRQALDLGTET
jgi:hypothetical protein